MPVPTTFFITDGATHDKLRGPMGVNFEGLKFAVGGRDSLHPLPGYDGILLYAFCMTDGGCHVQRCKFLVDGNHEGLIERRLHAPGYGSFDGQNALVFYDGAFHSSCVEMPRRRVAIGAFSMLLPPI